MQFKLTCFVLATDRGPLTAVLFFRLSTHVLLLLLLAKLLIATIASVAVGVCGQGNQLQEIVIKICGKTLRLPDLLC